MKRLALRSLSLALVVGLLSPCGALAQEKEKSEREQKREAAKKERSGRQYTIKNQRTRWGKDLDVVIPRLPFRVVRPDLDVHTAAPFQVGLALHTHVGNIDVPGCFEVDLTIDAAFVSPCHNVGHGRAVQPVVHHDLEFVLPALEDPVGNID